VTALLKSMMVVPVDMIIPLLHSGHSMRGPKVVHHFHQQQCNFEPVLFERRMRSSSEALIDTRNSFLPVSLLSNACCFGAIILDDFFEPRMT